MPPRFSSARVLALVLVLASTGFAGSPAASTTAATRPESVPRFQIRLVIPDDDSTTPFDELADPFDDKKLRVARPILLDESALTSVTVLKSGAIPEVGILLNEEGGKKLEAITAAHLHQQLAIVVDGKLLMVPTIMGAISRDFVITLGRAKSIADAEKLAATLKGIVKAAGTSGPFTTRASSTAP